MTKQTAHGTLLRVGTCLRQTWSGRIKRVLIGDVITALQVPPQRASESCVTLHTRRGHKATSQARHDESRCSWMEKKKRIKPIGGDVRDTTSRWLRLSWVRYSAKNEDAYPLLRKKTRQKWTYRMDRTALGSAITDVVRGRHPQRRGVRWPSDPWQWRELVVNGHRAPLDECSLVMCVARHRDRSLERVRWRGRSSRDRHRRLHFALAGPSDGVYHRPKRLEYGECWFSGCSVTLRLAEWW